MHFVYALALRQYKEYVATFTDKKVQKEIQEKILHTFHVLSHAYKIGTEENLSLTELYLLLIAALFHDIGRFPQLRRFQTFRDRESVNHAALSTAYFLTCPLSSLLGKEKTQTVTLAIYSHNQKIRPLLPDLKGTLVALLRDADKVDIYRVLSPTVPSSPIDSCSLFLLTAFEKGEQADYKEMKTQSDRCLFRLLWLYDLTTPYAANYMLNSPYLLQLIKALPPTPTFKQGLIKVHHYLIQLATR